MAIWEKGRYQHPVDKALTILSHGYPELTYKQLADFCVGRRDAHLLTVREQTFGDKLRALTICTICGEKAEIEISLNTLRIDSGSSEFQGESCVRIDEYVLYHHLPNSWDLASIAGCRNVDEARDALLRRCITCAKRMDETIALDELPQVAIEQFIEHVAHSDPQAELLLNVSCPVCKYERQLSFDIVSYLWDEIEAWARGLLWQVHILAQSYSWTEHDILKMSSARRQIYLDLVL